MGSVSRRQDRPGKWRARYRDDEGKQHVSPDFDTKKAANGWLTQHEADVLNGEHIAPADERVTVKEWSAVWLENYASSGRVRDETIRDARTHHKRIVRVLGRKRLKLVQPADIRKLIAVGREEGLSDSTLSQLHLRVGQLFSDAVHDGLLKKSPVSRRTSPGAAQKRVYVATEDQVWGFYDALHPNMRPAVLLGAFAGLRTGEAVALRVGDVDAGSHVIRVQRQHQDRPVKTEMSKTPIPISDELIALLGLGERPADEHVVRGVYGRRISGYTLEEAMRVVRDSGRPAEGEADERPAWKQALPAEFRFHDFRHYFASLLISKGLDVKTVQMCLRHESPTTTLETYTHMWPDRYNVARTAVSEALEVRAGESEAQMRTKAGSTPA